MTTTLAPPPDVGQRQYQDIKSRIHQTLLNRLNLERLSQIQRGEAEPELRTLITSLLEKEAETTPLNLQEREHLVVDVLNELFGLGPLEPLLQDPTISDILVNGSKQVYVERKGLLEMTSVTFRDDQHLLRIIEMCIRDRHD